MRAPGNGTVLNNDCAARWRCRRRKARARYLAISRSLRVRAEVEERDAAKITVGQKVVVKADAFPDKQFEGSVTSISQSLGSPRIATRGPRRPNDVEVVEVMVGLDGNPPLFTGMRVDVFFKAGRPPQRQELLPHQRPTSSITTKSKRALTSRSAPACLFGGPVVRRQAPRSRLRQHQCKSATQR